MENKPKVIIIGPAKEVVGVTKEELDKSYKKFVKQVNQNGKMIFGKDWKKLK